jgi:hypothetical protein
MNAFAQEVAVKCISNLCVGNSSNQKSIAERGAIPALLKIIEETEHPASIREGVHHFAQTGSMAKVVQT